jgi:hypothetical protein
MDDKTLETVVAHRRAVQNASRAILEDPKQREEFLAAPVAYLKRQGVPVSGHLELSERDHQIIRLIADPSIATLYNSGNVSQLANYLRGNYPGLVNDPSKVAWTVADFEVAIEAVAVAVGVFVAPLRPADDFSELTRLEAVHTARIDALETRIAELETQLKSTKGK